MSNSPPPANPVLDAYETFVRETPLVTRYILISQAITWIISFFMDLSLVANVPQFTIFKFQLYRIILSPFICSGLLSLVFAYLSFTENGRRLEFSMGSTAFACLILTIGIIANLGHLAITFLLYGVTGSEEWLLLPSHGNWIILFGVIAIECSQAPSNSMRKLFFFTVPTLYYPLALLGLFSLLDGFQLPYLLSIGVGYAYGRGYLDRLKIDSSRFKQWEETVLENFVNREGWIVAHEATGSGAWTDTGASSSGGLGLFSRLNPQQQQERGSESAAAGDPRSGRAITTPTNSAASSGPSFPAGGHQLGTASRRPASTDPRQARLEAIARRSGAGSNADNV